MTLTSLWQALKEAAWLPDRKFQGDYAKAYEAKNTIAMFSLTADLTRRTVLRNNRMPWWVPYYVRGWLAKRWPKEWLPGRVTWAESGYGGDDGLIVWQKGNREPDMTMTAIREGIGTFDDDDEYTHNFSGPTWQDMLAAHLEERKVVRTNE